MKAKQIGRIPLFLLLVSIVFALFTRTHKFLTVDGSSMEPTLYDRHLCIVDSFIEPERGCIYVLQEPDNSRYAIKRLIGIPGDTVELKDGKTYVNGELFVTQIEGSWEERTFHLGADEYLFLGDNRKDSYDGRYWSRPVKRSEVLYKVVFRIYPISRFGRLE